jgi:hypothetical protein
LREARVKKRDTRLFVNLNELSEVAGL